MFPPIAWLHLSVFKPHTTQNSSICSDAELTLETSPLETVTVHCLVSQQSSQNWPKLTFYIGLQIAKLLQSMANPHAVKNHFKEEYMQPLQSFATEHVDDVQVWSACLQLVGNITVLNVYKFFSIWETKIFFFFNLNENHIVFSFWTHFPIFNKWVLKTWKFGKERKARICPLMYVVKVLFGTSQSKLFFYYGYLFVVFFLSLSFICLVVFFFSFVSGNS